ncbi:protein of unknown function (DUF894) [Frankia torreyi]|uniref:Major Facilitator Superfamily transporter n=1 Tax=Frankia torreyi TaxID=1856 RepID=A0A0D8B717_9ACTN|nr:MULTISPECIES: MFS transporter [Frankia]KJE19971.1 protein of unknown function (DUF894) [Frankia torreyi]KQM02495.1 protein of unknown function (DUF894) [Frankia sp. CpI1-P]
MPLLARTVFHADATSFGLLTTGLAAGSLVAALLTTGRRNRPPARLVIVSAFAFGVLEAAVGVAPTFPAAIGLLALTGFATLYFAQAANHRIQLGSDPSYRGRVMALYSLILQGTTPLGSLGVGWLAEHHSARAGFYVGGLASAAAAVAAWAANRRWAPAPTASPAAGSPPTASPAVLQPSVLSPFAAGPGAERKHIGRDVADAPSPGEPMVGAPPIV